ncbi:hypothetical protein KPB2_5508 [Klebsiella pneumoniae Kb677]|nr:hypothetical protein KPB2_5508 [Klebsiella pneumoniae Kb677]
MVDVRARKAPFGPELRTPYVPAIPPLVRVRLVGPVCGKRLSC